MRMSIFSSNYPQVDLAINKERLRLTEDKLRITEERLEQLYLDLEKRDQVIEHMRADRDNWRLQFEGAAKDLKYTQDLLENAKQAHTSKSKTAYWLAGTASCIFFIASVLSNIGTSLLFSTPPNPSLAHVTLGISSALYIIGIIVTVVVAQGD